MTWSRILLSALLCFTIGCAPTVDLTTGLRLDDVATGWSDGGVVDGKNKIVPAVALKLTNASDQTLSTVQINAVFRRVDEQAEWGTGFLTAVGTNGLPPSQSTDRIFIQSERGYTSTDPRWALLDNSQFVDARVELFAKYRATNWTRLGEYPIRRVPIER